MKRQVSSRKQYDLLMEEIHRDILLLHVIADEFLYGVIQRIGTVIDNMLNPFQTAFPLAV